MPGCLSGYSEGEMRHKFLWALTPAILAGVAPPAHAQSGFSFAAQGVVNFSTVSYSPALPPDVTSKGHMVLGIGVGLEIHVFGPLSIAFQPTYLQKGDILQGLLFYDASTGETYEGTATTTMTFFEMPLLVKAGIAFESVKPYLIAGPSLGLLLSAGESDDVPAVGNRDLNVKDMISPADFGLLFGGGMEYTVSPGTAVTVDFRYSLGLRDLARGQSSDVVHRAMKSRGIVITLGILVPI